MKNTKKRKADIVLLAALLLIGGLLAVFQLVSARAGGTVLVRIDGEITARYPLSADRTEELEGYGGGFNRLVIENGTARITDASCPDGICVRTGRISKDGQSIICLPHRISIEVISEEKNDVDFMSGSAGG